MTFTHVPQIQAKKYLFSLTNKENTNKGLLKNGSFQILFQRFREESMKKTKVTPSFCHRKSD